VRGVIVNSHVGVIEFSYRTNEVVLDTDTGQRRIPLGHFLVAIGCRPKHLAGIRVAMMDADLDEIQREVS
jgi:hypothetical protein